MGCVDKEVENGRDSYETKNGKESWILRKKGVYWYKHFYYVQQIYVF